MSGFLIALAACCPQQVAQQIPKAVGQSRLALAMLPGVATSTATAAMQHINLVNLIPSVSM